MTTTTGRSREHDRIPLGDLLGAAELAEPWPDLYEAVGRLAAVTAARLRLPAPPFGDPAPAGLAAALLAAAVGGRGDAPAAWRVFQAIPRPRSGYDLVACHGVAAAVLTADGDRDRFEQVRDASPLTGVLDRPGPASESRCAAVLDDLLAHPDGRRLVALSFAAPPADLAIARWRAEQMDALRLTARGRELVLDVYEVAMIYFRDVHLRRVREADGLLDSRLRAPEVEMTATWWRPLAGLDRAHHELLVGRHGLRGYRSGIRFYRRAWHRQVVR